jgi:hypothetical protein
VQEGSREGQVQEFGMGREGLEARDTEVADDKASRRMQYRSNNKKKLEARA